MGAGSSGALSLGDIQNMPTFWVLALFGNVDNFCFHVQICRHPGGGVCVYFLKSARKRHFRNVWVGGRGGLPFFSVAQHIGRCTQTWHCTVHPFLFRITAIVSIPFFRQGWYPNRADIPVFVDRDVGLRHKDYPSPPIPPLTHHLRSVASAGYQAHAESPAPTLHPQSKPFCRGGGGGDAVAGIGKKCGKMRQKMR